MQVYRTNYIDFLNVDKIRNFRKISVQRQNNIISNRDTSVDKMQNRNTYLSLRKEINRYADFLFSLCQSTTFSFQ
jgi:hypothetical protein